MNRSSDIGVFDRWAPRLLMGLVALVPLVLCLEMDDTYDLPKMTLVYSGVILGLAMWVRQGLQQGTLRWRATPLDGPLLIFLISAGLSTYFSIDPPLSFFGAYRIYVFGWLPLVAWIMLYFIGVQGMNLETLNRVRTATLIAGGLTGLYAALQFTGYELFERVPSAVGGRVWSSLGNPIYLGTVCMMALPVALAALLAERRVTVGKVLATVGILAGLILSLSRGAWLGAILGSALVCGMDRQALKSHRGVLAFLALVVLLTAALPGVRSRVSLWLSRTEGSNAARIAGWKGGLEVWRDHPWLGSGTDTFSEAFRRHRSQAFIQATGSSVSQADAHNDFLQIASTQGVLGLLAFLGLIGVFLYHIPRYLRIPEQRGFAAALIALFVHNQFNFSSVSSCAWAAVFAGVLFGFSKEEKVIQKSVNIPVKAILTSVLLICPLGLWAAFLPFRADWFFKQGLAAAAGGQSPLALALYDRAIRLNGHVEAYRSEQTNTWRGLARALPEGELRQHYLQLAWESADQATLRHPVDPDAWNNRGVAAMWVLQLEKKEMFREEARRSFARATELDPVYVDAWANLAKWEHLAGHLDQEKVLWQKVLTLDPTHDMANRVLHGVPPS